MKKIDLIIQEELDTLYQANFPQFGDRLPSISEVGESNITPYTFIFDDIGFTNKEYRFTTEDNDDYIVDVINLDDTKKIWEMGFGVEGHTHDNEKFNYEVITNRGRLFKIMSTIVKIAYDFIERYSPNVLYFKPSKTEGEQDNRRFNLYMQYVKKNMRSDYFAHQYGDYIVIERKIKK